MLKRLVFITNEYKIVRGMLSYATLWPLGSLIEQTLVENRNFRTYEWMKCLRFSIYGAVIMGPTMYVWIRIANRLWPRTDIKSSISKALTELICYDPGSICTFLLGMSLLEGRSLDEARAEVTNKFLDTYKVGVVYWPVMQTLNFSFVPVKNQVVCTSVFSMIWSAFLAYEKHLEIRTKKPLENEIK